MWLHNQTLVLMTIRMAECMCEHKLRYIFHRKLVCISVFDDSSALAPITYSCFNNNKHVNQKKFSEIVKHDTWRYIRLIIET